MKPGIAMMVSGSKKVITGSDGFDTNTGALYTVGKRLATTAVLSIQTASSFAYLYAEGYGVHAVAFRNDFLTDNGYIECDTDTAFEAGIVFRYKDINNYYLLAFGNDSGTYPAQNMRLLKSVGGVFTQLGSSVDLAWSSGQKTFRLEVVGTSIKAYVGGVLQIDVTDSDISGEGRVGFYSNSQSTADRTNALRWSNAL